MKKRNKKVRRGRPEKQTFVQSTHQWNKEILVCTGFSAKQIIREIRRKRAKGWMISFAEMQQESWQNLIDGDHAFVAMETEHGSFVLRLRKYQDSWNFWEVLIHELSHLVDNMAERMSFDKESEAKAYLQEYLFHEIRRKLQGVVPYHSNSI